MVPATFRCRASYKARALEYSRRLRAERGLNDFFVKILFVDDDGVPTKGYIEKVFRSQYDVCEGIPTPRNGYGRFLSHMDDLRTINCIYMCSVFQGIGHPIHVHGEGLCVRGTAESSVTWDYEMFASEDLVFGHMAVVKEHDVGIRVGLHGDHVPVHLARLPHATTPMALGQHPRGHARLAGAIEHLAGRPVQLRGRHVPDLDGRDRARVHGRGPVLVQHPAAALGIDRALARAVRHQRLDQFRWRGVVRPPSSLGRDRRGAPGVRDVGRGDLRPDRRAPACGTRTGST